MRAPHLDRMVVFRVLVLNLGAASILAAVLLRHRSGEARREARVMIDFDPITFGAVGDSKYEGDCSTVTGSAVITCPSAAFTVGDVGKIIWCISPSGVNPLLALTTVSSWTSATQVIAAVAANNTITNLARCAWGTQDDTAGIQAAVGAATQPSAVQSFLTPPGRVLFPCGGFQVSGRILNVVSSSIAAPQMVGGGKDCTSLIVRPDFAIPGDGTAALMQVTGTNLVFRDFSVNGLANPFTFVPDQDFIRIIQASNIAIDNVQLIDVNAGPGGDMSVLSLRDVSGAMVQNLFIQGHPPAGVEQYGMRLVTVGNATFVGSTVSNYNDNVTVISSHGRTPLTAGITWLGGLIDECFLAGGCLQLHDSDMTVHGSTVFGNPASPSVTVDGTSSLYMGDANVGAFNAIGDASPAVVAAGGRIVSRGTTWRVNGAGQIVNAGDFLDGFGNDWQACNGATCVAKSPSEIFSGRMPVHQ